MDEVVKQIGSLPCSESFSKVLLGTEQPKLLKFMIVGGANVNGGWVWFASSMRPVYLIQPNTTVLLARLGERSPCPLLVFTRMRT